MISRRATTPLVAVLALVASLSACASGTSGRAPSRSSSAVSSAASSAPASGAPASGSSSGSSSGVDAAARWMPSHVVVVVEENHSYRDILTSSSAPYLHFLAAHGANLTGMYAVTHPSEPNYLAMFSGSTQHLTDDSCPHRYPGANLGSQLAAAHHTLLGYSEDLPSTGSGACNAGAYARRHAPWTNFTNLPSATGETMASFPSSFAALPSVSYVIPNLAHDMHDGTIGQADSWLNAHLGAYAAWARTHNSLLVVTWDEDDHSQSNLVPTIFYGAHVSVGSYSEHADHYRVLRTLEWLFGLPGIGTAAQRRPLTDIWTA